MSGTAGLKEAWILQLEAVIAASREFQKNRRGMALMAADPERRAVLEKALAEFNQWLPTVTTAASELRQCRDALAQVLQPKRRWRLRA